MTITKYFGNLSTLAKRGFQAALLGSMTAMLVSCGGGGADPGTPQQNGPLGILPSTGFLYPYVAQTFTVAGGTPPYLVVSDQQILLPLNIPRLDVNTFTVAPNQPSVFDIDADPVERHKTVNIQVRDAKGLTITGLYKVIESYLTGYTLTMSSVGSCNSSPPPSIGAFVCSGTDGLIRLQPSSNGLYYARKQFRFTANYGAFSFITDSTGITGPTFLATADDMGALTARIRVTPNAPTQYAQFRMTDIVSGNYRDFTFVILNSTVGNTALSTLPSAITLSGADSSRCGTGLVNLFVFGGTPPYRATTTFPDSISITPPILNQSGDAFTVSVFNPNFCLAPGNIIVTDSTGANATVTVTTTPGANPPVVAMTVIPGGSCLQDNPGPGNTIAVLVSGGAATKLMSSSAPSFASVPPTMTGSGSFTIIAGANYATLPGPPPAVGTPVTITVTDGVTSTAFNITRKTTCP